MNDETRPAAMLFKRLRNRDYAVAREMLGQLAPGAVHPVVLQQIRELVERGCAAKPAVPLAALPTFNRYVDAHTHPLRASAGSEIPAAVVTWNHLGAIDGGGADLDYAVCLFENRSLADRAFLNCALGRHSWDLEQRFASDYQRLQGIDCAEYPYRYLTEIPDFIPAAGDPGVALPSFSFVYCARYRDQRLILSISSLLAALDKCEVPVDIEIILCLEGELTRELRAFLGTVAERVTLRSIIAPDTAPWSRARILNPGIFAAEKDITALCDADFLFPGDYLERLASAHRDPVAERTSFCINCFETHPFVGPAGLYSRFTPYGYQWCFITRVLQGIGGLDEGFVGHGFEDRDLQSRYGAGLDRPYRRVSPFGGLYVFHLSHAYREGWESRDRNRLHLEQKRQAPEAGSHLPTRSDVPVHAVACSELPPPESCAQADGFLISPRLRNAHGLDLCRILGEALGISVHQRNSIAGIDATAPLLFLWEISPLAFLRDFSPPPSARIVVLEAYDEVSKYQNTIAWINKFRWDLKQVTVGRAEGVLELGGDLAAVRTLLSRAAPLPAVKSLREHGLERVRSVHIDWIEAAHIADRVQRNIKLYNYLKSAVPGRAPEPEFVHPSEYCELYLRNRYLRLRGTWPDDDTDMYEFWRSQGGHGSYFSELMARSRRRFFADPEGFLRGKSTVVLLDPTAVTETSGISGYLTNLYKLLVTARLTENVLYLRNHFTPGSTDTRLAFRHFVGAAFAFLKERRHQVLFIDSEAHYPGRLLPATAERVCLIHCSLIMARWYDGKMNLPLSEHWHGVLRDEYENIVSARFMIAPTRFHLQRYRERLKSESFFTAGSLDGARHLINYIHDTYTAMKPFAARRYDLIFVGRPQELKGFGILLEVAKVAPELRIGIVTNTENKAVSAAAALGNCEVMLRLPHGKIIALVGDSRALIDLSPHHNCSTVFLEAINAKTPAIVRDLDCYQEILSLAPELRPYFSFIAEETLGDITRTVAQVVEHLRMLKSIATAEIPRIERLFNGFMLSNYRQNVDCFRGLLRSLGFREKTYCTNGRYGGFLLGKRVVAVAPSATLKAGDGRLIDGYDVVVRFNKALLNSAPDTNGARTDVLYNCMNRSPESGNMTAEYYRDFIHGKHLWCCKAYPSMKWQGTFTFRVDFKAGATYDNSLFETFCTEPLAVSEFSLEYYRVVEANIRCRPNTGFLAILDLLQYEPAEVCLKGFTFFKGGYDASYRTQNEQEVMEYMREAGHHNQYRQNLLFRKILYTDTRITMDDSLRAILLAM